MLYALNGSYIKGMGGMENRPFDYIWLLDDAEREASRFIDEAKNAAQMKEICEKTKVLLRDYYSNYSLELLASVDFLLNNVPALHNWRNADDNDVLDTLTLEIQNWSKRKEHLFKRNYLSAAYHYLKDRQF